MLGHDVCSSFSSYFVAYTLTFHCILRRCQIRLAVGMPSSLYAFINSLKSSKQFYDNTVECIFS